MGRGAHYPPGAVCGVVLKGILIVLACLQFLGILDLAQLLNLFHTDSVLLRNLSQCFAFSQITTWRNPAAGRPKPPGGDNEKARTASPRWASDRFCCSGLPGTRAHLWGSRRVRSERKDSRGTSDSTLHLKEAGGLLIKNPSRPPTRLLEFDQQAAATGDLLTNLQIFEKVRIKD